MGAFSSTGGQTIVCMHAARPAVLIRRRFVSMHIKHIPGAGRIDHELSREGKTVCTLYSRTMLIKLSYATSPQPVL
jgi:hypothetical protein